jgi:segregation and condensation protein A
MPFEELFAGLVTRFDLVITFLALLEMTKLKMTRLYQTDSFSPLHVELSGEDLVSIDSEVMTSEGGEALS